jgi:hypothetical protein
MTLDADLDRIAAVAAEHGPVSGVLAAEPTGGRRTYLVAYGEDDHRGWLAFDADARPLTRREAVRGTASIVVMSELAGDVAGGGQLEELRGHLAQLRLTENPPGIEEAEEAALVLERTIGSPPRVAAPEFLDAVGAATLRLERALGDVGSPFANAMKSATTAVDAFVRDVEQGYKLPLD